MKPWSKPKRFKSFLKHVKILNNKVGIVYIDILHIYQMDVKIEKHSLYQFLETIENLFNLSISYDD